MIIDDVTMEEVLQGLLKNMHGKDYSNNRAEFFNELEDALFFIEKLNEAAKDYGTFELEEHYGGEGQGEDYWTVFSFTDLNGDKAYYRFEGYWESWDGVYYDEAEIEQVVSEEVTITKWVAANHK